MNHEDDELKELIPDEKDMEIFMSPSTTTKKSVAKKDVIDITPVVVDEREDSQKISADYEIAQKKLREVLEITTASVDELVDLAQQSQHPRVYEVLNGFLKTLESTSKSLIELHKQKQDLEKKEEKKEAEAQVNNVAVFVGSTKELSDIMKNVINKKN